MPHVAELLLYIAIGVLIASIVEAVVLSRHSPGGYDWASMGVSIADMVVRNALRFVLPATFILTMADWVWAHRIATVPLDGVAAFAALFIGQEFCYYWYHRAGHRMRWFWLSHGIHHSSNSMNLAAAYRLSWTAGYTGVVAFFMPLVWLGFPVKVVLSCLALNLFYQFWLHTTWIPKLGWFEKIFNTPSAHRVHHASNVEYLDGNYGGVLVVFDHLFGTYIPECQDVAIQYGWVEPIHTRNVFKLQAAPWIDLFKDLRKARSVREVAGLFCMPPGWRADGLGSTTEQLRHGAVVPAGTAAAMATGSTPGATRP
jgi:sterol desaturase/sphingolipid hydroxylase (fatty acid hydroxylase superfamily)